MSLDIITREMWSAQPPLGEMPLNTPVTNVFVLNVKVKSCSMFSECKERVWRTQCFNITEQKQKDIRFNFLIGGDGTVYEGRGWESQPSLPYLHSYHNGHSILIGYIGYYLAYDLPKVMSSAAQELVKYGIKHNFISDMFYYQDIMRLNKQNKDI